MPASKPREMWGNQVSANIVKEALTSSVKTKPKRPGKLTQQTQNVSRELGTQEVSHDDVGEQETRTQGDETASSVSEWEKHLVFLK